MGRSIQVSRRSRPRDRPWSRSGDRCGGEGGDGHVETPCRFGAVVHPDRWSALASHRTAGVGRTPSDTPRTLPLQFAVRRSRDGATVGERAMAMDESRVAIRRAVAALARGRGVVPGGAGGAGRAERAGDRRAGDGQAAAALSPDRGGAGRCPRADRAGAGGAGGRPGAGRIRGGERAAAPAAPARARSSAGRRTCGRSSPACRPGRTGC